MHMTAANSTDYYLFFNKLFFWGGGTKREKICAGFTLIGISQVVSQRVGFFAWCSLRNFTEIRCCTRWRPPGSGPAFGAFGMVSSW